jgi:hypothetical protein
MCHWSSIIQNSQSYLVFLFQNVEHCCKNQSVSVFLNCWSQHLLLPKVFSFLKLFWVGDFIYGQHLVLQAVCAWCMYMAQMPSSFKNLIYCNVFDQTIARQQLCKHIQTCNNRGMSSLLSSYSINILVAANAGNSSECVTITCYWATER